MADNTLIEWADATVNAVNGCSVLSPGCTNCYAMKLAGTRLKHHPSRAGLTVETKAGPVWNGTVRLNEDALMQPLRWKRPRRIFWNAHGDLFHEAVPDEWIDHVFAVCALTPQHTHMILTKRTGRMREWASSRDMRRREDLIVEAGFQMWRAGAIAGDAIFRKIWPLPNVWLGTSVEDQTRADERIPHLLATPAAVRFISAEPLLGPVDLTPEADSTYQRLSQWYGPQGFDETGSQPLQTRMKGYFPRLDWVIVGGESGPGARPMHPDWARSLRDQCAAAEVTFLFKQWGEWLPCHSEDNADGCGRLCWPDDGRDIEADFSDMGRHPITSLQMQEFWKVGKKRAGRLLDGRMHSEFPA
jgi:protein gp37